MMTTQAIKMIADWRDKVGFYKFFDCHIQDDKNFHSWCPKFVILISIMKGEQVAGKDVWAR